MKLLRFQSSGYIPSAEPGHTCIFPFSMIDERYLNGPEQTSRTTHHQLQVFAPLELSSAWGLSYDMEKLKGVLFYRGEQHIINLLGETDQLDKYMNITLDPKDPEMRRQLDWQNIPDPDTAVVRVQTRDQTPIGDVTLYVQPERIAELRDLGSKDPDFSKLIRLSEELNITWQNRCYFAVGILTRALVDHVPRALGFATFAEVVSNYKDGKSFKDLMKDLDRDSRNIADGMLHSAMRSPEVLPTVGEVNFSPAVNALIGEIIRHAKSRKTGSARADQP